MKGIGQFKQLRAKKKKHALMLKNTQWRKGSLFNNCAGKVCLFIHTISHHSQTLKGLSIKPEAKKLLRK